VLPLVEADVIDQVVVVDDSGDGTSDIARSLGAEVHSQSALLPEFGPVRGKGDAMWRALSVLSGEIVCFVDADSEDFGEHFVLGLIGPLLKDPDVHFVKGYYRRPLRLAGCRLPEGGGRVTELLARPLLNRFYPELAAILQPLAGEIAARRALLERLPFATGYAVDIGLLIDAWSAVGLAGLAQVDLDCRQNRHQPLVDLGPMAAEVLGAVAARLERDGRLASSADPGFLAPDTQGGFTARASGTIDRPPLGSLVRGVAAGPMFA
jgi:glucosyl-3-phosphoglycerate synthase